MTNAEEFEKKSVRYCSVIASESGDQIETLEDEDEDDDEDNVDRGSGNVRL